MCNVWIYFPLIIINKNEKFKLAGVTKGNKKVILFLTATTESILIFFSYTPEFP